MMKIKLSLCAMLLLLLTIAGCGKQDLPTLEQFNRVQNGMTVAEVERIFGIPGREMQSFQIPTLVEGMGGEQIVTKAWGDPEANPHGPWAGIVFMNGRVQSKMHMGLR